MNYNDRKIYLDVDGPLCDWVGGVENLFNVKLDRRSYNIHGQLGMTRSELFKKLDGEFYATLPLTPWASELIEYLAGKGELYLCTAACHESPEAAWGRFEWHNNNFYSIEMLAMESKHLLAQSDAVLIDDLESNTTAFGTNGLLWPAQHNANRNIKDPMAWVQKQFETLDGGL